MIGQRTARLYRNSFSGLRKEVWLMGLVSLINRSGTMVVPFLTVYLTQKLGFTLEQAGWVMTCFGAGSILGAYIGGKLTDKIGYYHTLFWSLLLGGLLFIWLGHVTEFVPFCFSVFFLSLVADAFRPAVFAAVAVYSRKENITRSYSLIRLSVNLGFSIGPAAGGLLAATLGYQWLFWADGITCVAAAFVFWTFLPLKKEEKQEGDAHEQAIIRSAYRDRVYLVFILFNTFSAIAFMQFFSLIPVFYSQHFHLTEFQIGGLIALNGLMITFLEMPLVYILDGRVRYLYLIAFGNVLIGLSYLFYVWFGAWVFIVIISEIVITFGEMLSMPFANAFATERADPGSRGSYMGLYTMSYSISHVIAPVVGMQFAAAHGFHATWFLLAGFCTVAALGFVGLHKGLNEKQ